jgi:protein tyrosine phosphatase (PTP) superfamily phosphohydrolase (DUF442 family)
MRRRLAQILLAGAVVLIAVGATGAWLTLRTYHYATVDPGVLYRCGNRGIAEFSNAVGRLHPRTVVSLVDNAELADPAKPQFAAESGYLNQHRIEQDRIPVKLGGWPSSGDVRRFLAIVENPTKRPVLVHCAQGVRRTGMFVAAYQESVLHYTPHQAKERIVSFGHNAKTVDDIKTFIDHYDPASRTVAPIAQAASAAE